MAKKTAAPISHNKVDLNDLFVGLQRTLQVALEVNRQNIPHPGTKGDASEVNWLKMLEQHLPSRYQAQKAFVVDSVGNLSDQIDVVIFDRHYCPLLLNRDGALYVPAESVYAIFEVKQTLNKAHIEYAGKKAASVRSLHRTSVPIPHAGGTYPPKTPFKILAGLLTLDCDWKPAIGEPLRKALASLADPERLDLGCALQHGSFEVEYKSGTTIELEASHETTALIFFFMRLLYRLQMLATVPAIDLHEYTKNL